MKRLRINSLLIKSFRVKLIVSFRVLKKLVQELRDEFKMDSKWIIMLEKFFIN